MKRFQFHQFVVLVRGPVNTAIIDFLKGDIYQVENGYVDKFKQCKYNEIKDFLASLHKEELIIEIQSDTWIPRISLTKAYSLDEGDLVPLILEIEEGVSWDKISDLFSGFKIREIRYFGGGNPPTQFEGLPVARMEKDFSKCITRSTITGEFGGVTEDFYAFSMIYNNCQGGRIALTADGKIRPCIYSQSVVGEVSHVTTGHEVIKLFRDIWGMTKDKIERCKQCELRYACFDCREIASRLGNPLGTNPNCNYNPLTGAWGKLT